MTFYITRHAHTFATVDTNKSYANKELTTPILEEGKPTIVKLATYLKDISTDHNARSELLRVEQTAQIISQVTGKHFVADPRLNELLDENNMLPPYPYTGYFENKREQFIDFINEMNQKSYKSVLVCTHGIGISGLRCLLTKGNFEVEDIHTYTDPGVLLIIKNKKVEQIDFN